MQVLRTGSASILTLVGLYWLIVVTVYMVRGRIQARKARPDPDGRVVLSGSLHLGGAAAVLLGPPVGLILILWLITVI